MTDHEFRTATPMRVTFNVQSPSDQWLRDLIAGDQVCRLCRQEVIVQGSDEAHRIMQELAMRKYQKRQPYGGAMCERAS